MKMTKLTLVLALLVIASPSQAGFVDNRASDAVIEITYKAISVEDLFADIVPREVQIEYASADLRKKLVTISGKGTWVQLLEQSASGAPVRIVVDQKGQRVSVAARSMEIERIDSVNDAKSSITPTTPQTAAVTKTAPVPATFTTTGSDYHVSAVLRRWATQANMQYVWEPRDVEYQVSAENDWGTDVRVAVRNLLTSVQTSQGSQAGRERVRACIHANTPKNVLRIIKFDERCKGGI
ncbi:toxin co-regulated pilus biosynthesis protein Q [Janthinobacterium sp. HH103]|nr:toxin co-regulated pilus biosynthesis protein Q [Janthinobacterium sp. HH103]QOU76268.1 hypothetical protein JAB4_057680 [Janthinobacterium sp. HH102]